MAVILADDNFKCIFLNENDRIPIKISLKFIPRNPIDYKSALDQVMAWHRRGDKPLPESVLTQFTDAYMRHWGEISYLEIRQVVCMLQNVIYIPTSATSVIPYHTICTYNVDPFDIKKFESEHRSNEQW